MDANPRTILNIFNSGGDIIFVLPPFQREYSWGKLQWEALLQDAFAIYDEYDSDETKPEHFLGSLVVIDEKEQENGIQALKLVDGQQRLTTISLFFCALRDINQAQHPKIAKKFNKLLVNPDEEEHGNSYFKLLPTNKYGDRIAYQSIITQQKLDLGLKSSIPDAYEYIYESLQKRIRSNLNPIQPDTFYDVVTKCFQVVYIKLDSNESPYKIFESLNAKGKVLSQADLVRNYIAMRLPTSQQDRIFDSYWAKIETLLQEKKNVGKFGELTAFIRHYLASESKLLCSEEHIYARFRDRCEQIFNHDKNFIEEVIKLSKFAEYYNYLLRPESETDEQISEALSRLNRLDLSTAYPFLLCLYNAYELGKTSHDLNTISKGQFLEILKILENYLVRRYLVGEQTNYLNKMFPALWPEIQKDLDSQEKLTVNLKRCLSTKRYPSDEDISEYLKKAKLYEKNPKGWEKLSFVLENINRFLSSGLGGYTVLSGKPTVEHILPQTPSSDWQESLGFEFERVFQNYLHTLGNLTLVTSEWNARLSNHSFKYKKDKLAAHGLKINADYFSQNIQVWDEDEILKRLNFLLEKIFTVWPSFAPVRDEASRVYNHPPEGVVICGEVIDLPELTWRQLRIVVVEWGIRNRPHLLLKARQELSTHFCADPAQDETVKQWQRLSDGFYLSMSYSAKDHLRFCRNFLEVLDVPFSEWSLKTSKES